MSNILDQQNKKQCKPTQDGPSLAMLADLGGPFCVGPVHLHFIEIWGLGIAEISNQNPVPQSL